MNTNAESKRLSAPERQALARAIKAIRAAERLRDCYVRATLARIETLAPRVRGRAPHRGEKP